MLYIIKLRLQIPYAHSLKDKRSQIKSLKSAQFGARATPTLMMLLIDYVTITPVRLIAIPQVVPSFPITDVVGFELILVLIFISNISEISTLFYLLTLAKLMSVIGQGWFDPTRETTWNSNRKTGA